MDYGKIFPGLFEGSLCDKGPWPKLLMVALVIKAEPDGTVRGSPQYLASYIGCSREEFDAALGILEAADPESASPAEDGRRVLRVAPGVWRLVNYEAYRDRSQAQERREYWRDRKAQWRKDRAVEPAPAGQPKPRKRKELEIPGTPEIKALLEKWLADRRERRLRVYTQGGLDRLARWLSKQPDPEAVVETAIRNQWAGLSELRPSFRDAVRAKVAGVDEDRRTPVQDVDWWMAGTEQVACGECKACREGQEAKCGKKAVRIIRKAMGPLKKRLDILFDEEKWRTERGLGGGNG